MMTAITQDARYALRQLWKAPGFATTVVLTLALSVGVATAVFCVIDAAILRPLPFAEPDRIVSVEATSQSGYTQPASWPSYQDEREQAKAFDALAGFSDYKSISMERPGAAPVLLRSVHSTDNFFRVFGVAPLLGRTYLPGEEQDGKNSVVVLSYQVWQSQFNGDKGVLNQVVKLDGQPFTVIGVMPAGFRFPLNMRNAIYVPRMNEEWWVKERGNHWLQTVGRLKDGVSIAQAQSDMTRVFGNLSKAYPDTDGGRKVRVRLLSQSIDNTSKGPLWTLLGAVLAVLAIGCVNVAGLLLARGVKREHEMAMRVAIGASRGRLLGQMLTEGLLLALFGAAAGVALAMAMLAVMRTFLVHALERGADIQMNWAVLGAAVGLAVVTSLAASLYPSLRLSGVDPNLALKSGGRAGTERGQTRLRSIFVVTQVALTLVLLAVSGLLLRVISQYRHADFGFDPAHIVAVSLNLSKANYQNRAMLASFYHPLEEQVSHLHEVKAAGLINLLPIDSWGSNSDIHIAGQPPYPPNQEMLAENRMVSPGYFKVMGIPLHAGRQLSASLDRPENVASTVVVNDAFVHKFIPAGLDPTAQRIDDSAKQETWTRIVGVTGNVKQNIYGLPLAERDFLMDEIDPKVSNDTFANITLLIRTDGDPMEVIPQVRAIVHNLDPTVPFGEPRTMTDVISEALIFERMESWLFAIFAGLALTLAMVGLYGLVSQEVEQGRRDIGVRMALGATRGRVLGTLLRRVAWMLGVGALTGQGLTLLLRSLIGVVVYFNAQHEVGSSLLLALVLIVAGLLAAVIPAIRAASIEPMQALRSE
jgi:putative ABC transport system permease protein